MTISAPPNTLQTLSDVLEMKAATVGNNIYAKEEDSRSVTFSQLDTISTNIAKNLHEQGVSPGEHVCLYLYNHLEYLYMYFGLAKLGAVAVPIDTRFTEETLLHILQEVDGETIVFDDNTRDQYEKVRGKQSAISAEYCIGSEDGSHQYKPFSQLKHDTSDISLSTSVRGVDPFSVVYVQQRQGSTPTGITLPHYAYVNTGWVVSENILKLSSDDSILTPLPLYSVVAAQTGMIGSLMAGGEFIILDRFEPKRFWKQVSKHSPSVFLYLSRMLSVLYNHQVSDQYETNPLETAVGHGYGFGNDEQLIREFEEKFDITVLEGYGTTQVATIATHNTVDDRRVGSVGKPAPHVEVQIFDDDDWPLPPGEMGEIVVRPTRSNTMMKGYHNDPELTVKDCQNQWIHTGDTGYLDEEGYLFFISKRKNSIYRGQIAGRISTLEIESVINTYPAVRESVVTGITSVDKTEEIMATAVLHEDQEATPSDIYHHCKKQLPYVKVPRFIDIRDTLPRTPAGKIRKSEIQQTDPKDVWDRESGYEFTQ